MPSLSSDAQDHVEPAPSGQLMNLYNVILTNIGHNRGAVLPIVRRLTGISTEEFEALVQSGSETLLILHSVGVSPANLALLELKAAGATVIIQLLNTQFTSQAGPPMKAQALSSTAGAVSEISSNSVQVEPKNDTFNVILEDFGENKIQVIKAVRELTGLGLKEAKDLIDVSPTVVLSAISQQRATEALSLLSKTGARCRIVPPPYLSSSTEGAAEDLGRISQAAFEIHKRHSSAVDSASTTHSEALKRSELAKSQQTQAAQSIKEHTIANARKDKQEEINAARSIKERTIANARKDKQEEINAADQIRQSQRRSAGRLRSEVADKTTTVREKVKAQGWDEYASLFGSNGTTSVFTSTRIKPDNIHNVEAIVRQIDKNFSVPGRLTIPSPYPFLALGCIVGAIIGGIVFGLAGFFWLAIVGAIAGFLLGRRRA